MHYPCASFRVPHLLGFLPIISDVLSHENQSGSLECIVLGSWIRIWGNISWSASHVFVRVGLISTREHASGSSSWPISLDLFPQRRIAPWNYCQWMWFEHITNQRIQILFISLRAKTRWAISGLYYYSTPWALCGISAHVAYTPSTKSDLPLRVSLATTSTQHQNQQVLMKKACCFIQVCTTLDERGEIETVTVRKLTGN